MHKRGKGVKYLPDLRALTLWMVPNVNRLTIVNTREISKFCISENLYPWFVLN